MTSHERSARRPDTPLKLPVESESGAPPAFGCIVYFSVKDGVYSGRVANLDGITESAASQRDLLAKIVRRFKSAVSSSLETGSEPPWLDPPLTKNDAEKKLFLPVHL